MRTSDPAAAPADGAPVLAFSFADVGAARRGLHDAVAPVTDTIERLGADVFGLADSLNLELPSQTASLLEHAPMRVVRPVVAVLRRSVELGQWGFALGDLFWHWKGVGPIVAHLIDGALDGLAFAGELLVYFVEYLGLGELLQALWQFGFVQPLPNSNIAASQEVHPHGSIPYWQVKVDYGSVVAHIATLFQAYKSGTIASVLSGKSSAVDVSVTTMHVIHTLRNPMPDNLAVHELSHVMQYELVGAMYMPQAIHAQLFGDGYDYDNNPYGSLTAARQAGVGFSVFNREQQAQICQDYYLTKHGHAAMKGGAFADLEYFINDLWGRELIPVYRNFGI